MHKPYPDAIRDAPDLRPGLALYYEAFWELSTCRQFGMAAGPIPWVATRKYCECLDLDVDMSADMHYFIRQMDHFYLEWNENKRGNKS